MDAVSRAFADALARPLRGAALRAMAGQLKPQAFVAAAPDRLVIAATFAHAAFLAPDEVAETFDAFAEGWLGGPIGAPPIARLDRPPETAPEGLWAAYWEVVEDARAGRLDAGAITMRTAALGGMMPAAFQARLCLASHAYAGVGAAADAGWPARIELAGLAACPPGSLGRRFHDLIVENGFDLEVLDRDAIGLTRLPPPLGYLNARILQAHDLWHIVAGYETTALHEVALSAFQMAQFGHSYSAQFLAVAAGVAAVGEPAGFGVLMDMIATAWAHGRQTPPLMLVAWEEVWREPVETIRARFSITPYASPFPPDLFEQSGAAA